MPDENAEDKYCLRTRYPLKDFFELDEIRMYGSQSMARVIQEAADTPDLLKRIVEFQTKKKELVLSDMEDRGIKPGEVWTDGFRYFFEKSGALFGFMHVMNDFLGVRCRKPARPEEVQKVLDSVSKGGEMQRKHHIIFFDYARAHPAMALKFMLGMGRDSDFDYYLRYKDKNGVLHLGSRCSLKYKDDPLKLLNTSIDKHYGWFSYKGMLREALVPSEREYDFAGEVLPKGLSSMFSALGLMVGGLKMGEGLLASSQALGEAMRYSERRSRS